MVDMSHQLSVGLPADELAPIEARRHVAAQLAAQSPSTVFDAQLVASELVTHVIRHGMDPRQLTVGVDEATNVIRIDVGPLALAPTHVVDPHDTGLTRRIVEGVSDRWGFDGEVAWAEMYLPIAPRHSST